jgi:hypothetical protein
MAFYRLPELTRPLGLGHIIALLKGIGHNGLVEED